MSRMRIIVAGGFLGAGKTTLLTQAAKYFTARGKCVGIITNDQAANLVDTHILSSLGIAVQEVPGGCFCCRFADLEIAAGRLLQDMQPDVLLSEPVGSCTDISATVLQPIKKKWGEWAELSPYSVLADPRRLRQLFDADSSSFPESVRYIIKKQFEEADYLVINKVDLISPSELAGLEEQIASAWPGIKILKMSALKNQGVAEWLETISHIPGGGNKIIDVDYETYASGEAELGWLNASLTLFARQETDWDVFVQEIIGRIHAELASRHAEIGHLKLLISNPDGQTIANATSIEEMPVIRSCMSASEGTASLIVNARARLEPQLLKSITEQAIKAAAGNTIDVSELRLDSLKPSYPKPTYRFDRVIDQRTAHRHS